MVLVTEPTDRPSPLSTPEQVLKKSVKLQPGVRRDPPPRGVPVQTTTTTTTTPPDAENGGEDRQGRTRRPGDLQLSVDTESDLSENRKKPSLRFKSAEPPSPMLSPSDSERKFERKKTQSSQISKSNVQYHKLFKEISKDELLKQSYTCALQKDILYQGKMFVSDNWICFHSKVFGRDTRIAIPVLSVTFIKKTKTAILVPNALVITTTNERHVFVSFLSRDTTYKLLRSLCVQLDGDITGSSPVTSSCENSFRVSCPSSLPLDFSGDFSDLNGVVRQRRQEMLESSSSGSQTPDYENMAAFPSLPDTFLSPVKPGEVSVHADVHLQSPGQKHGSPLHQAGPAKPTQGAEVKDKALQPTSLHTLLLVYLFLVSVLVLSSCYMAYKIVALEQRLNSLVSMGGEYPRNDDVNSRPQNAEIYGELSTNLFKLEKIQRNLRKLLEET